MAEFKFSEIRSNVKPLPGIYEIYSMKGVLLKVGIAGDLKKRLLAHGKSKQNSLKLKDPMSGYNLENVVSKQSILAKHLYFDSHISTNYDLTNEKGRVSFLEQECRLSIQYTTTREEAREIEKVKELSGNYRYFGRVQER